MLAVLRAVTAVSTFLCALRVIRAGDSPLRRTTPAAESHQAGEANARFVYEVLERALARTVDGNRYVDALLLGILATDIALLVLVVGTATAYRPWLLVGTTAAAAAASAALALSLFVREAPDPALFKREAKIDVCRARRDDERRFVAFAEHNDRIHAAKRMIFIFALLVLLAAALVATAGTMLESGHSHEAPATDPTPRLPAPAPSGMRSGGRPAGDRRYLE